MGEIIGNLKVDQKYKTETLVMGEWCHATKGYLNKGGYVRGTKTELFPKSRTQTKICLGG